MNFVRHHSSVRLIRNAKVAVATHETERAAILQVAWVCLAYVGAIAVLVRASILT